MFCSELHDPSFLFASDNGDKFSIHPMRFTALLKMTRVKVNSIISDKTKSKENKKNQHINTID